MITYDLQIDLDKDGLFQNTQGHIGDRLVSAQWLLGASVSFNQMAQPLQLRAVVKDDALEFSQDKGQSPFSGVVREIMARIRATVNGETYTLVTGWVTSVSSEDRANGSVTVLFIECKTLQLQDAEYAPDVGTSVRIDTEIDNVFTSGVVGFPYHFTYWVLGGSKLNEDTKLFENKITTDTQGNSTLEQSQTTLDYTGDAADMEGQGVSALGYIMQLVQAEVGGRFFTNREARFEFHSRHHDISEALQDTFTDDEYHDFQLIAGEVYNESVVNFSPRAVGSAGTLLFAADVPITVNPGETVKSTGRFRDVNNEASTVGASVVIEPVEVTDYAANSQSDGGGDDKTLELRWAFETTGINMTYSLTNSTANAIYVTLLKVRGTPLIAYKSEQVIERNAVSIRNYGLSPYPPVYAPFISDKTNAKGFARQMVTRYGEPTPRYETVSFQINSGDGYRDDLAARVLPRTIGHRVKLTNAQTGHDKEYVIAGESHQINGQSHVVTWVLLPSDRVKVWRLDISKLDTDTVLAL